ncbi:MAG: type II secretion system F family protein [Filifactor alocis]|nr:type II secretion system F family protein [Filifactor alocis]
MEEKKDTRAAKKPISLFELLFKREMISLRAAKRNLNYARLKEVFYMLYTFLERKIPLYQTIRMMEREFPELIPMSISEKILGGDKISEVLYREGLVDRFVYETLQIGEESGSLKEGFEMAYLYYEDRIRMKEELQKIALYPIIIITNTLLLLIFCSEVIFPQLIAMYESTQTDLPALLVWFDALRRLRSGHVAVWIAVSTALVLILMNLLEKEDTRLFLSRQKYDLPLIGRVYRSLFLKMFTWQVSVLSRADIRVVEALDIIREVEEDLYLREVYEKMLVKLREGSTLHQVMEDYPRLFSSTELSYIRQAEESGAFDDNITALSLMHRRNAQKMMDKLSTYAQPVILICLGILVGLTVFSIMPLLNVSQLYL